MVFSLYGRSKSGTKPWITPTGRIITVRIFNTDPGKGFLLTLLPEQEAPCPPRDANISQSLTSWAGDLRSGAYLSFLNYILSGRETGLL